MDHACFDQLRKKKRRREDASDVAPDPASPHPAVAIETRDIIVGLLADLDEDERRIAVCSFVDGMSQGDIAQEIGLSRVTINKKISQIRERARIFLEAAS